MKDLCHKDCTCLFSAQTEKLNIAEQFGSASVLIPADDLNVILLKNGLLLTYWIKMYKVLNSDDIIEQFKTNVPTVLKVYGLILE